MNQNSLLLILCLMVSVVTSASLENSTATEIVAARENSTKIREISSSRQSRANTNFLYADLIACAIKSDTACFVDIAEDFLTIKKNELLAQADQEVSKATGRADPDNSPSALAKTIEKLISDLSGLFKNGLSSWFDSRETEDDELVDEDEKSADNEESDTDDEDDNASRDIQESRTSIKKIKKIKKKPIKKVIGLLKVALLVAIVAMKVSIVVKVFEAGLKFKLLLVGLASFGIQAIKFWMDLKSHQGHEEGVLYKNPYEGSSDWSGPGVPGEYNARSARAFDYTKSYAQNRAYSEHSPTVM